jgi:hypothetical protein
MQMKFDAFPTQGEPFERWPRTHLGIKWRHSYQAVHPSFSFEPSEGVLSAYLDARIADAKLRFGHFHFVR